MKTKTLLVLFGVLIIVLVVLVKADRRKNEQMAGIGNDSEKMMEPVKKTSDVDSAVSGLIRDYEGDNGIAAEGDSEVEYVNYSASLINPQGVYNANEF